MHGPPLLHATPVRPQEEILEDVRACITSLCNVASIVRLRAHDGEQRTLMDETISHLLRLGTEARGLSRERCDLDTGVA